MEINLENLIPFEKMLLDPEEVFQLVESKEKILLLKENKPAYLIIKYSGESQIIDASIMKKQERYTLQEAMKIVLLDVDNHTLHAADLADEIFRRGLYAKKDGEKAQYNQIRARCGHYPNLFETLPGNIIKLKEGTEE